MSFKKTKKLPLDTIWFNRLHHLTQLVADPYLALMPPKHVLLEMRLAFESSHHTMNPSLYATHLDHRRFEGCNDLLRSLRYSIYENESNRLVYSTYERAITELIAKNNICISSTLNDHSGFSAQNLVAYGAPNFAIFTAAVDWIRTDLRGPASKKNARLLSLRDNLLQMLPELEGNPEQFLPSKTTYERVRKLHFGPNGCITRLFDGKLPTDEFINQEIGDAICSNILKRIDPDYKLADSDDGIWGHIPSKKLLLRPARYSLPTETFIGIVSHEIGSHIIEKINGSHQPLKLLETGLDHYEYGNEGRALLREQIVLPSHTAFLKSSSWEYAIIRHLLISFAEGLGGQPYNFAQTYKMAYTLFSFWREQRYPNHPKNEETAREEAWQITIRLLKGTSGQSGAFVKDIVYLEGNIRCWQIARRHPEMIIYGDLGKYDIANLEHLKLLRKIGVLSPLLTTRNRMKTRLFL